MNHPTDQADELFLLAKEALGCEDPEQAVVFLRKAVELAPLRKDIRRFLAKVLESSSVPADFPGLNSAISSTSVGNAAVATAPILAERVSRTSTANPVTGTDRSFQRVTLPPRDTQLPPNFEDYRTASEVADTHSVTNSDKTYAKYDTEPATPGQANRLNRSLPRPFIREDMALTLEDDELNDEEDVPASIKTARSKSRKRAQAKAKMPSVRDIEDVIAFGLSGMADAWSGPGRSKMLYAIAYMAISVFITVACLDTARKFKLNTQTTTLSADSTPVQIEQPRPEPAKASPQINPAVATDEDRLSRGQELLKSGRFEEAVAVLQPLLDSGIRTANRDKIRETLASAWATRGTEQLKADKLAESVSSYRHAVTLQPGKAAHHLHLGNALYYCGRYLETASSTRYLKEAVTSLQATLSIEPNNSHAYQVLAASYEALGNKKDAKSAWTKVNMLAGKETEAWKTSQRYLARNKVSN